MPWLKGETKEIGVGAFQSWILCGRHNNSASSLDAIGGHVFRALRDNQIDVSQSNGIDPIQSSLTLVNGPLLQLWLLKVLLGAMESKSILVDGKTITRMRLGVSKAKLVEILWRGDSWPQSWGFYLVPDNVARWQKMNAITFGSIAPEGELLGSYLRVGAVDMFLAFERPARNALFQPGAIVMNPDPRARGPKMIALAWPQEGQPPYVMTKG